jgi:hypothetical protein
MGKFVALSTLFFLSSLLSAAQSSANVNGLWCDSSSVISNAYAVIAQEGGKITFSHYLEWKGHSFVEIGSGKWTAGKLKYKVKVTLPIEGWATRGTHELYLSEDGNTLRGRYHDNKGRSGEIVLKRFTSVPSKL